MGFIRKMKIRIQFIKIHHPCEVKRAGPWFYQRHKKWHGCENMQGVLTGIRKNIIFLHNTRYISWHTEIHR